MNDAWEESLSPQTREVLASSSLDECDDADFERVGAKVTAAIAAIAAGGTAAGAAGATGVATTAVAGMTGGASLLAKVLGALVGSVLVGSVAFVGMDDGDEGAGAALEASAPGEPSAVPELGVASEVTERGVAPEPIIAEPFAEGARSDEGTAQHAEGGVVDRAVLRDESARDVHSSVPVDGVPTRTGFQPAARQERTPLADGSAILADGVTPDERRADDVAGAGDRGAATERVGDEGVRTEALAVDEALASELLLLQRIRRAVRRAPRDALALADEHRRTFGESPLAPERELYRIRVLFRLGREREGVHARRAFRMAYPDSPYLRQLEQITAGSAPGSP